MLRPGDLLQDTYIVVGVVARGGMGHVYEVRHRRLAGRYALKVLRDNFGDNPVAVRRFRNEAAIASSLGHRNIVTIIDFNLTPTGAAFIVMEYVEGENLGAALERAGRLDLARTLHIVDQVAAALAAAHGAGVVHCDLKPQNVMMVRSSDHSAEQVKVIDFGIAKVMRDASTSDAALLGTPRYMAPEQIEGRSADVDGRTDQFALAAMTYELLAGRPAFEGDSLAAILHAITSRPPPALETVSPEVPPAVGAVIRRALSPRKSDRYASISEFAGTLRRAAAGKCVEGAAPTQRSRRTGGMSPASPAAAERAKSVQWWAWAVAAALVAAVGGAESWRRSSRTDARNRTGSAIERPSLGSSRNARPAFTPDAPKVFPTAGTTPALTARMPNPSGSRVQAVPKRPRNGAGRPSFAGTAEPIALAPSLPVEAPPAPMDVGSTPPPPRRRPIDTVLPAAEPRRRIDGALP